MEIHSTRVSVWAACRKHFNFSSVSYCNVSKLWWMLVFSTQTKYDDYKKVSDDQPMKASRLISPWSEANASRARVVPAHCCDQLRRWWRPPSWSCTLCAAQRCGYVNNTRFLLCRLHKRRLIPFITSDALSYILQGHHNRLRADETQRK